MDKETAQKILKVKDALVEKDIDEAYHWLYQIASPNFDKMSKDVWTELEELASGKTQPEITYTESEVRKLILDYAQFLIWCIKNEEVSLPVGIWFGRNKKKQS